MQAGIVEGGKFAFEAGTVSDQHQSVKIGQLKRSRKCSVNRHTTGKSAQFAVAPIHLPKFATFAYDPSPFRGQMLAMFSASTASDNERTRAE